MSLPRSQSMYPSLLSPRPSRDFQAFLWDFDGCFCDSEKTHFLAYQSAFSAVGYDLLEHGYYETFTHKGNGAATTIEANGLSCSLDEIRNLKNEFYWELLHANCPKVYPEIPLILEMQRAAGAKIVIVSNSPEVEIQFILDQNRLMGVDIRVDEVTGKTPGAMAKPAPDLYLRALDLLGMSAKRALAFEDSERGLAAALSAGIDAVWVRNLENQTLTAQSKHLASLRHSGIVQWFSGEMLLEHR